MARLNGPAKLQFGRAAKSIALAAVDDHPAVWYARQKVGVCCLNVPGTARYQGTATNVGTTSVQLLVAQSGESPPIKGSIHRVIVTWTGPATKVAVLMREGAAGPVRVGWTLQSAPFDNAPQPHPVGYDVAVDTDIVWEVYTDDGTFATTVTVKPEIEGVA